jgi:hypothetical protein
MDLDPVEEPQLDAFSLALPLPYRVGIIVVCGMHMSSRQDKEYD